MVSRDTDSPLLIKSRNDMFESFELRIISYNTFHNDRWIGLDTQWKCNTYIILIIVITAETPLK